MEAAAFRRIHPTEYYKKFISQDVRPDGRPLTKFRKGQLTVGSVNSTDGSAMLRLGKTSVVAGVKLELAKPEDHAPSTGRLVVSLEMSPMCSPLYKPGRPSEHAVASSDFLTRLLTGTHVLPEDALCAESGKAVWNVHADVYCLNYDGNVVDAAMIALVAALQDVTFPTVTIGDDGAVGVDHSKTRKLTMNHIPIPASFGCFDEYIICDPTAEEEALLNGAFTVVYNNEGQLLTFHKPGGKSLSEVEMQTCMQIARERVSDVVSLLQSGSTQS